MDHKEYYIFNNSLKNCKNSQKMNIFPFENVLFSIKNMPQERIIKLSNKLFEFRFYTMIKFIKFILSKYQIFYLYILKKFF